MSDIVKDQNFQRVTQKLTRCKFTNKFAEVVDGVTLPKNFKIRKTFITKCPPMPLKFFCRILIENTLVNDKKLEFKNLTMGRAHKERQIKNKSSGGC